MRVTITIEKVVVEFDLPDGKPQPKLETPDAHSNGTRMPDISKREHLILASLAEGLSNKEIARKLVLCESTVKVHMKSVLRKLRLNNRTQAALWARANGPHVTPLNGVAL